MGNGGGDSSSSSSEISGEGERRGEAGRPGLERFDGDRYRRRSSAVTRATSKCTRAGAFDQGRAAHGIHAQSVGGGGGAGGAIERHGLMEASNQVSIGVGGNPAASAVCRCRDVDNDAVIRTTGDDSHGVFAQSIARRRRTRRLHRAARHVDRRRDAGGANFSVQLGGTGGEGAAADEVDVNNTRHHRDLGPAFVRHRRAVGGRRRR